MQEVVMGQCTSSYIELAEPGHMSLLVITDSFKYSLVVNAKKIGNGFW